MNAEKLQKLREFNWILEAAESELNDLITLEKKHWTGFDIVVHIANSNPQKIHISNENVINFFTRKLLPPLISFYEKKVSKLQKEFEAM
jgi:hypothetical protein